MAEVTTGVLERIKKFHAHLDICSQCRNHCFDLCPIGALLLKEAATGEQTPRTEYEQGGKHGQTKG